MIIRPQARTGAVRDECNLKQILVNLTSNVNEFTDAGGEVSLTTQRLICYTCGR